MIQYIIDNKDFFTIIIAFFSFLTSLMAIILSITSTILQNKFNRNSVQPYCDIIFETNKNYSSMEICNNGLGVMVVNKIYFYDIVEKKEKKLSTILKDISFKTYCERTFNQSSVAAGDREKLYEATFNNISELDKTIKYFKIVEIHILYSDIYGKRTLKKFPLEDICNTYIQSREQKRAIK